MGRLRLGCVGVSLAMAMPLAVGESVYGQTQAPSPSPTQLQPQNQPQAGTPPHSQAQASPLASQSQPAQPPQSSPPPAERPRRRPQSAGIFDQGPAAPATDRTRQQLTFFANIEGGYDDNFGASSGTGQGFVPTAFVSGYTGSVDAALDYFRGNNSRSVRVRPSANVEAYEGYVDQTAPGADVRVDATTSLGQRYTLGASQQVGYSPYYRFGPPEGLVRFAPPSAADVNPRADLFARRALASRSAASLERKWGHRTTTRASYDYFYRRYTDDEGGDGYAHSASAEYRRTENRNLRIRTSYRYLDGRYSGFTDAEERPLREHRVEGGPELERALSGRRRATLSLGAGASYVETIGQATREPLDYWAPYFNAESTLEGPTWVVGGGYRRDVSGLQGLTDRLYNIGQAYAGMSKLVTSRMDVRVGGSLSHGRTPVQAESESDYRTYGASVVWRVALTRQMAATASYQYYYHRYSDPGDLPSGFPARYDRNTVRVGLTFWVPLVRAVS